MSIAITVTFPCSDSEWNKLVSIRALLSGQEIKQSPIEELSGDESQVLNAIASAEEDDETPTLDFLEGMGVSKLSGSAKAMIESYMNEHPSTTCEQAIKAIAAEYPNVSKCSMQQAFYSYRSKTGKGTTKKRVVYSEGSLREAVQQYMSEYPDYTCAHIVEGFCKKYPVANWVQVQNYFYKIRHETGLCPQRPDARTTSGTALRSEMYTMIEKIVKENPLLSNQDLKLMILKDQPHLNPGTVYGYICKFHTTEEFCKLQEVKLDEAVIGYVRDVGRVATATEVSENLKVGGKVIRFGVESIRESVTRLIAKGLLESASKEYAQSSVEI
jgi:hypothetical protein